MLQQIVERSQDIDKEHVNSALQAELAMAALVQGTEPPVNDLLRAFQSKNNSYIGNCPSLACTGQWLRLSCRAASKDWTRIMTWGRVLRGRFDPNSEVVAAIKHRGGGRCR